MKFNSNSARQSVISRRATTYVMIGWGKKEDTDLVGLVVVASFLFLFFLSHSQIWPKIG